MFEIPFNFILTNPAIDILVVISISYYFLFRLYKDLLESYPEKIMWMDLKVTAIFLLLGYLNYSGNSIEVFSFEMEWWFYIVLSQMIIEGIFILINLDYWKKYMVWMKKDLKEKEEENLDLKISQMKSIQEMMEKDLNNYKIQGNKNEINKLKLEIEKISVSIDELEEDLRELRLEKNDKEK